MVVTGFDGKEYEVEPNANLSGTDLSHAHLGHANLSRTNLAVEGSSLSWRLGGSRLQSPGSEGGLLDGV